MIALQYLSVVIFGLALGSFATAMIHRIPRGLSWWSMPKKDKAVHRSACPHCKATLRLVDLIPLFSWLSTRGKCRYCAKAIGLRYPLTELGVVLACLATYAILGFTSQAFFIMAAIPFLAALLVIDLEHLILPNQLVVIIAVIGMARLIYELFLQRSFSISYAMIEFIAGAVIYAAFIWGLGWIMTLVLKKEALGFGDVKFFAAAGLWLGLSNLAWFCMAAGVFGVAFGLAWQILRKDKIFPFGPSLIASLYVLLLLDGSLLP